MPKKNKYNKPKERLKEISAIRIYEDDRIETILQELLSIKQNLITIKRQLSAHDYNITGLLK